MFHGFIIFQAKSRSANNARISMTYVTFCLLAGLHSLSQSCGSCVVFALVVFECAAMEWNRGMIGKICRLQDQLIIFMALGEGESKILCTEPTLHTRTAMVVAEQLTAAKFQVHKPVEQSGCWQIYCKGAAIAAGTIHQ